MESADPAPGRDEYGTESTARLGSSNFVSGETATDSDLQSSTPRKTASSRPRKAHNIHAFGKAVPAINLPFPIHANITAAELLAFLPNSIQCADVIYRFVANGGTRRNFWAMVSTQRDLLVEWTQNCCGTTMYKAMRDAGYEGWTVGDHGRWHDMRIGTWDETSINVGGFRTPAQVNGTSVPIADILFRDLAKGVRQWPQQEDALDLTRMIQYCVENPGESWMYPKDFDILLEHLGGPSTVKLEHRDRAVFKRWTGIVPPAVRIRIEASPVGSENRTGRRDSEMNAKSIIPDSLDIERQSTLEGVSKSKRKRIASGPEQYRTKRGGSCGGVYDAEETTRDGPISPQRKQPYVRAAAEYVAPPNYAAGVQSELVDANGQPTPCGVVSGYDLCSTSASDGPRRKAPFRLLHHIAQPHASQVDGWAENLRWAYEQRACFSLSHCVDSWDESPEHMEAIATIRQEQTWASDELIAHICEEAEYDESDSFEIAHREWLEDVD
ncbi:hypothetical protein ACN47E_003434 [Coniothyrium glycines]